MCRTVSVLIIINICIISSDSARILGVIATPSYSHQIVFQPLWRELSLRGHQVVTLTTDLIKDKSLTNLTEIDLSHTYSFFKEFDIVEYSGKSIFQLLEETIPLFKEIVSYQLSHADVQALIKDESQHFDLVLVESLYPATLAFSERFKCPYIIISSLDALNYIQDYIGNPTNPILYPDFLTPYVGKMGFVERVMTLYFSLYMKRYYRERAFPLNEMFIERYFGPGYPSLDDIHKKVSMIFVNTEPILHPIRPLVPAVIPIGGGMHLKYLNSVPFELKQRLDNATEGFIYFSLGTNVKSKHLHENNRRSILNTLAELPYQILWKFELDELEGKPDNVFISKWFPQQAVLEHPNIKLFITQGGLQSMEEAVHNKVPLVVMPFFADQPFNAKLMVDKGIALEVDYKTLDKTILKNTILEVINNSKYRKNVEALAALVQDQQTIGLERAVWWTEYVLRHKGAQHLRGPAINIPFYQQYMLDIIGAGLLVLTVLITLLVIAFKILIRSGKYLITNRKKKTE